MTPTDFPESNKVYAVNQPPYKPLPAFHYEDVPVGPVVSCWSLSFRERLRVLFTGKVWLTLLSFNKPLTPSHLTTVKSEVICSTK